MVAPLELDPDVVDGQSGLTQSPVSLAELIAHRYQLSPQLISLLPCGIALNPGRLDGVRGGDGQLMTQAPVGLPVIGPFLPQVGNGFLVVAQLDPVIVMNPSSQDRDEGQAQHHTNGEPDDERRHGVGIQGQ